MAISHIGSNLSATNASTTASLTIHASTQEGDFLVVEVHHRSIARPTISDNDTGGNAWTRLGELDNGSSNSTIQWWKIATAGSAGKTVSLSGMTSSCAAHVTTYRGVDTTSPFDVSTTQEANASSAAPTHAGITTLTAGAWVCAVLGEADDRLFESCEATDPATLTIRANRNNSTGNDSSMFHCSAEKTTAGATGTVTWGIASAAVTTTFLYALKPASEGPSGQTLTAGNQAVTTSAPAATVSASVVVAAGTQAVTVTAPAAAVAATITRAAGAQAVTTTAPSATLVPGMATVAAGAQVVTVTAPAATASASGGTQTASAGAQAVTFTAPTITLTARSTLAVGVQAVTTTAPAMTVVPGGATVTAGAQSVTLTAPTASIEGGEPDDDHNWCGATGNSGRSGGGEMPYGLPLGIMDGYRYAS